MNALATTTQEQKTAPAQESEPLRMSYEDYLKWDHEGVLAEWVNGEVMIQMPTKREHQRVVRFLVTLLDLFARLSRLGIVQVAPFVMRAVPDGPAREPDLFFVLSEHVDRLTRDQLNGPADLAVEVVSDDSVARDRADKFYEYQDAGVREYWIIDPRPDHERVDFYILDGSGRYQPVPVAADGTYHSTVLPDLWIRVDWLWQEEPDALAALREIVGVERLIAALRE